MSEHSIKDANAENGAANGEVQAVMKEDSSSREHHHHHHHHHHHSSHSSDRHAKKKKRSKWKSFLRHNRKKVMSIAIVLILVVMLIMVAIVLDRKITDHNDEAPVNAGSVKETDSSMIIEVSFFEDDVALVSPAVSAYLNADVSTPAHEIFKKYRGDDNKRLDYHAPLQFSYQVKGLPDGYTVKGATLLVADNEKFTNVTSYKLSSTDTGVNINYLKTDAQYYYRLKLNISNGSSSQIEGSFKTKETPRILAIDGIYNVRDIGGWKTESGKRIKQGLLYRGTELDGVVNPSYKITENGVNTMLTKLGIRSELDLRSATEEKYHTKMLGVGVNAYYYTAPAYKEVFSAQRKETVRTIFSDLAVKENYPAYIHCTYGLDRTGTICYLLEALLGVSEEDLIRDYQLSSLHHGDITGSLNSLYNFIDQLKTYEGATMQEKAANYLLSCGVTQQEINNIRSIFLAD